MFFSHSFRGQINHQWSTGKTLEIRNPRKTTHTVMMIVYTSHKSWLLSRRESKSVISQVSWLMTCCEKRCLYLQFSSKVYRFLVLICVYSLPPVESLHTIIVWRATEKKEASVVKIRSILWKNVRGVSRATEKKEASVVKIRSILWKNVRGVWRATEKKEASVVKIRSILWKNVRVCHSRWSVSKNSWTDLMPVGGIGSPAMTRSTSFVRAEVLYYR